MNHQYIDRETGTVRDEKIFHDRLITGLYSAMRERGSLLYRLLTSARLTSVMASLNYDFPMGSRLTGGGKFVEETGVDLSEFYDSPESLDTARKFFERKIRYWECRPMPDDEQAVAAPADSRMLPGSFRQDSMIFLKEKFFSYDELMGDRKKWADHFRGGDFAVFRLTPDKYHYSHVPVSGIVEDIYEINGAYNSCNPGAVVSIEGAYSKNRRVVTVIDTDVKDGSLIGKVVMIEIVALMIGDITQAYSPEKYDSPADVVPGMFLKRGQPKSISRPGSSVDILIFERGKIEFSEDIVKNSLRKDINTRFAGTLGRAAAETDVKVRSEIAGSVIRRIK